MGGEKRFRFQELVVWQRAIALSPELFSLADTLESRRHFRFAEQLRGAALSITNNIAEGSGSVSDAEFCSFLNYARRSVFEVANILLVLTHDGRFDHHEVEPILAELEEQSRMLMTFIRSQRPH